MQEVKGASHSPAEIASFFRSVKSCLIVSHYRPEADALGSQLALYLVLKSMGVKCRCFNDSGVPEVLRFLPSWEVIEDELPRDFDPECVAILDCAHPNRVSKNFSQYLEGKLVVNIDHHETNNLFGDFNYVDPAAAATGVLIYRVVKQLQERPHIDVLTNIYAAIVSDTGNFAYSNTNAEVFELAMNLVKEGVNPHYVSSNLYFNWPFRRMKLLALALKTLEFIEEKGVSFISIFRWMYDESGGKPEDTEEFVNYARDIKGVKVAFLIRELESNLFKISIRVKDETFNAAEMARALGGGGHRQAAGAEVEGSYEEVKKRLLELVG